VCFQDGIYFRIIPGVAGTAPIYSVSREVYATRAEEYAKKWNVTILLKGAATVVTDGVRTLISRSGTAGQAKGGSGDVLSGVIAGLCASALNGFDGAVCAAYLCGKAAELATADIGEYSLTASDVVGYLGKAFLSLRR
jgi:NAD(P)H-hydrate epimerase